MTDADRQARLRRDITYGTNNEFGFDYLRDNMKFRLGDLVQREFNYAIVDEVDSILIDEARTPLIISGPTEESTDLYYKVDKLVRRFHKDKHFKVDEKTRTVSILEDGVSEAEKFLSVSNLYDLANMDLVHHINQSLKAHYLFKRDVDYMVKDGQVIIVDEFTGRLMPGRRYSDGLHQALEAKERVKIEEEYQTLASITFQNYFRMYKKLAGMTGTAATEATEFRHIYRLDVVEIPTNQDPHPDSRIPTSSTGPPRRNGKPWLKEIIELNKKGRPVLVGTVSIEKSEHLSTLLRRKGVKHVVLNAKYHEQEAEHHRPGRADRRRDHRHQHGRPRRGHPARRQPRLPGPGTAPEIGRRPAQGHARSSGKRPWPTPSGPPRTSTRRSSSWAASTSSAPSATRPAGSTTSSAAGPAARATPAPRGSTSASRTT